MTGFLLGALQYYGAAASVLAAILVALDLGRRWTGIAMVIFVTSSLALIAWGFAGRDNEGIGLQNVMMLGINAYGVWRYLLSPRKEGCVRSKRGRKNSAKS